MARSAYEYALDLLAARAYTSRNLRRKLVQKEYPSPDADAVIERLLANGILDDARYATEYATQRFAAGSAVRRVKQELARKGIDGRTADAAIAAVLEDQPLNADAEIERLARKKLQSIGEIDDFAKRRRITGFLARRGYELDDIRRIVERVCP